MIMVIGGAEGILKLRSVAKSNDWDKSLVTLDTIIGKVSKVIICSINQIFKEVYFKKIIPIADSAEAAIHKVDSILKGRKEEKKNI